MISDYLESSILDTNYSLYVINTKYSLSYKITYKVDSYLPDNKNIYIYICKIISYFIRYKYK